MVEKQARAVWGLATFVGFFVGIVFLVSIAGAVLMFFVRSTHQAIANSQTMAHADQVTANMNAQREEIVHANDAWWDSAQPDGMKAVYFGKEYLIGPGEWTSIDVRTPAPSGRFRYEVVIEGVDRFRARPNGEAEREFVYPNREGLQPYQMSGICQTLLVQPLDSAVHRVRVKYVRMPRN
jgi:hypothetical protein